MFNLLRRVIKRITQVISFALSSNNMSSHRSTKKKCHVLVEQFTCKRVVCYDARLQWCFQTFDYAHLRLVHCCELYHSLQHTNKHCALSCCASFVLLLSRYLWGHSPRRSVISGWIFEFCSFFLSFICILSAHAFSFFDIHSVAYFTCLDATLLRIPGSILGCGYIP